MKNFFTTFINEFVLRGLSEIRDLLPDARQMTRYAQD